MVRLLVLEFFNYVNFLLLRGYFNYGNWIINCNDFLLSGPSRSRLELFNIDSELHPGLLGLSVELVFSITSFSS